MAYLTKEGEIRTADPEKIDMPEIGELNRHIAELESFIEKTKRVRNHRAAEMDTLARSVKNDIDQLMYLVYLNVYLFRLNNYYDYDYTRNQDVTPIDIYKMVQSGEMPNIWAPVKAKKYNKVYNTGRTSKDAYYLLASFGDKFSEKGSNIYNYSDTVNKFHAYVKEMYTWTRTSIFYDIIKELNNDSRTGRKLLTADCINPNKIENISRINPVIYSIDLSGNYTGNPSAIRYRATYMKDRQWDFSYADGRYDNAANYTRKAGGYERVDIMRDDLFFKPLTTDLEFMTEYFLRYGVFTGLVEFDNASSYFSRYGQFEAVKFLGDIGSIVEKFVQVVKRIVRLPTPEEETKITIPNTVFKKIDYVGQLLRQYGGEERIRLRGKSPTVESFMKKLFVQVGIRLNELANYNPIINGSNFIPIFGVNGSIPRLEKDTKKVYSIFSPINGYTDTKDRFFVTHKGTEDTSIRLEYARFAENSDRVSLLDINSLPGDLLTRAEKLFKEPHDFSREHESIRLNSITENQEFRERFLSRFGEYPDTRHMIAISVAEMVLRYLLGSVRTSMVPRLRYEVLHPKLLENLNNTFNTNFPYGTKFVYIAFYTSLDTRVTVNEYSYGNRITDFIEKYINTGYSNKWGVKDTEILKTIKKLEGLSGNSLINDESVKIISDTIYQVVINLINESARGVSLNDGNTRVRELSVIEIEGENVKSFKERIERDLEIYPYRNDEDLKRHILLPLLDDMRKNSDFN